MIQVTCNAFCTSRNSTVSETLPDCNFIMLLATMCSHKYISCIENVMKAMIQWLNPIFQYFHDIYCCLKLMSSCLCHLFSSETSFNNPRINQHITVLNAIKFILKALPQRHRSPPYPGQRWEQWHLVLSELGGEEQALGISVFKYTYIQHAEQTFNSL